MVKVSATRKRAVKSVRKPASKVTARKAVKAAPARKAVKKAAPVRKATKRSRAQIAAQVVKKAQGVVIQLEKRLAKARDVLAKANAKLATHTAKAA